MPAHIDNLITNFFLNKNRFFFPTISYSDLIFRLHIIFLLNIKLRMKKERFQNIKDLNTKDLKKQEKTFLRERKRTRKKESGPLKRIERK